MEIAYFLAIAHWLISLKICTFASIILKFLNARYVEVANLFR